MFPPCSDSWFDWAIGVTGRDDIFFPLGDDVLEIIGSCSRSGGEPSSAGMDASSTSEQVLWNLKLSLGIRVLVVDSFLVEEGTWNSFIWLLRDGVGGLLVLKNSSLVSSSVLVGISVRLLLLPCVCLLGSSSVISDGSTSYTSRSQNELSSLFKVIRTYFRNKT